jgi:hypothetical protein
LYTPIHSKHILAPKVIETLTGMNFHHLQPSLTASVARLLQGQSFLLEAGSILDLWNAGHSLLLSTQLQNMM